MEQMIKELLQILDEGEVITKDVLESAYDQHQLWEVYKNDKEWYGSNVFTYDDLINEVINNGWVSDGDVDEIFAMDAVELFKEHGYTALRV